MTPTKTGANDGEENSPRSRSTKNLSLREGKPPADSGGLIGAKLWWRRWGALCGVHVQRLPTKRGANDWEKIFPRSSLAKKLSLMG